MEKEREWAIFPIRSEAECERDALHGTYHDQDAKRGREVARREARIPVRKVKRKEASKAQKRRQEDPLIPLIPFQERKRDLTSGSLQGKVDLLLPSKTSSANQSRQSVTEIRNQA